MLQDNDRAAKIAALNDELRKTMSSPLGRWYMTIGVRALDEATRAKLFRAVSTFDAFTLDNDPHDEHDFGQVDVDNQSFFWKIDYFDKVNLDCGAEDASDASKSTRVLTLMLASEY